MMRFDRQEKRRWNRPNFNNRSRIAELFGSLAWLIVTVATAQNAIAQNVTAAEQAIVRGVASAEHVPLDQAGLTCGRDCLYIWLRLQGFNVSYDDIESRVYVGPQGSEMSEIVNASRVWEPSARLGKLTYKDLCTLKGPAIVHVWVTQGKDRQGHYMVVTQASEKEVSLIETATQIRTNLTPQEFSSMWSSYALYKTNPVLNWDIMALSLLPLAAIFLIVNRMRHNNWRLMHRQLATETAAVLLGVLLAIPGCGTSSPEVLNSAALDESGSSRKIEAIPIAASKRHIDLGIVPFGKSGTAKFLITNIKNEPVQLQLGQPSCGCTKAVLSDETIGPKSTVTLEISLGAEGGVYSGPREGSVELGIKGNSNSLRFSVEGILEGVMLFPYTIRLPKEAGSDSPGPLEGEITLGLSRNSAPVSIDDLTMPAREESGLAIGQAVFKPSVEVNGFVRRGFEIPISVRPGLRPKTGVYIIRMTGKIGHQTFEVTSNLFVVPAMED